MSCFVESTREPLAILLILSTSHLAVNQAYNPTLVRFFREIVP